MATDVLTISRLHIQCDTAGPAAARHAPHRVSTIARTTLGPALAQMLDDGLPHDWRNSDQILCIPKMEIELDVDITLEPSLITRAWARVIAISTLKLCSDQGTLKFSNQSAYLAAFIIDFLQGRAWQRWYWREFDGLKPLSTSTALQTALRRDPEIGITAFRSLTASNKQRLLESLDVSDAHLLLSEFVQAGDQLTVNCCLDTMADEALRCARLAPPIALSNPEHFALLLIIQNPIVQAGASTLGAHRTLALSEATLAHVAGHHTGRQSATDTSSVSANSSTPPADTGDVPDRDILRLTQAIEGANKRLDGQSVVVADNRTVTTTCFGGAFILWPHILALPIAELFDSQPEDAHNHSILALRQSILARALGVSDPSRICHDPSLAHLIGTIPPPDRTLTPPSAQRIAAAFDPWFIKEGMHSANWRNTGRHLVLKEDVHGYWLRIGTRRKRHPFASDETQTADTQIDIADAATLDLAQGNLLSAQLAQIICKRMVYRIPGFANASIKHTQMNFISMGAEALAGETIVEVRLGPAPLSIMLNLTGMSRQNFTLDDGRTVQLVQGDAQ